MKKFLLIAVCWLALAAPVHAQTSTPTPQPPVSWPPDPTAILEDGVTWTLLTTTDTAAQARAEADNEGRAILFYDGSSAAPRRFPFPPGVDRVASAHLSQDGTIAVQLTFVDSTLDSDRQGAAAAGNTLLLDPATGEYRAAPAVCGGRILQAQPGSGHWAAVAVADDPGVALLCHTETGAVRDALPAHYRQWKVGASPDGTWLVMVGRSEADLTYHVFSYRLDSGTVAELGVLDEHLPLDPVFGFHSWIGDRQGMLVASDSYRSYPPAAYFAFDVTAAGSLTFTFSGWPGTVFYSGESQRYASLHSDGYSEGMLGSGGLSHTPCRLTVYDAAGLRTQDLGWECQSVAVDDNDVRLAYRQGERLYFLVQPEEDVAVTRPYAYDFARDAVEPAPVTGEFESIAGMSPDGDRLVLFAGDDGTLARHAAPFDIRVEPMALRQVVVAAWNGAILYRSEPGGFDLSGQVTWPDDDTLVIAAFPSEDTLTLDSGETQQVPYPCSLRMIRFADRRPVEIRITPQIGAGDTPFAPDGFASAAEALSPDGRYWLTGDAVFDLESFTLVPLLRADLPAGLRATLAWSADSRVLATIRAPGHDAQFELAFPASRAS